MVETATTEPPDGASPALLRFGEGALRGDHELDPAAVTLIGRSSVVAGQGIQLPQNERASARASAIHAGILCDDQGRWVVEDLDSSNGTLLDGIRLPKHTPTPLPSRCTLQFGERGPKAEFVRRDGESDTRAHQRPADYALVLARVESLQSTQSHLAFRNTPVIRIGRDPAAQVVLESSKHAEVSDHHALIQWTGRGFRLLGLGKQGTFVDGAAVTTTMLEDGQIIEFGRGGPKLAVLAIETHGGTRTRQIDELQAAIDALEQRTNRAQRGMTRRNVLLGGLGLAAAAIGAFVLVRGREDVREAKLRRLREQLEPSLLLAYSEFRILVDLGGQTIEHDRGESFGTAFFVRESGHAITNRHVIEPWRGQLDYARALAEARAAFGQAAVRIDSVLALWPAGGRYRHDTGLDFGVGFNAHRRANLTIAAMPELRPHIETIDELEIEMIPPDESDLALLALRGAEFAHGSLPMLPEGEQPEPLAEVLSGGFPHGNQVLERDRAVPTYTLGTVKKVETSYQVDISAAGGSSGSPALDLEGRVIGVTTRKREGDHVELIPARAIRALIAKASLADR